MAQTQAPMVRKKIVVDAPIERAFTVFTDRFGDFKPPEHNLLGAPIAETVFERVGGGIVDRATDGTECRWARILAFDPPDRVVFSWDISPRWSIEPDPAQTSEVEVRFYAEAPTARGWNWSTATSTGTAPAGSRSPTASTGRRAGRCTWTVRRAGQGRRRAEPMPGLRSSLQQAGRVLVVTARRVLLLQGFDPARPGRRYWSPSAAAWTTARTTQAAADRARRPVSR